MLLPSELKLTIGDYLDPQSSINFGMTCSEHWKLCQSLFARHTKAFAEAPTLTEYNALDILRATIQDPSQAWYIREVSFRDRWDDPFTTRMEDAEQLQYAARQLKSLYDDFKGVYEDECLVTQIEHGLATGHPASAVAVLLHHLPNLRTLRLTIGNGNVFETILECIGIKYADATRQPSLPLRQLRTVALAHDDSEGCINPDLALRFLHLPSLRTFAASMMGGDFERSPPGPAAPLYSHPQSNVEDFFFVGCQFQSSALDYLLSCTPALKRFTYDGGGCCTSEDSYDAKIVLKALAKHTQRSLECLILAHFNYNEEEACVRDFHVNEKERPTEADLSMFTKLHSLSANWAMLWPELSSQPAIIDTDDGGRIESIGLSCTPLDIRDILPASLENLHLSGIFDKEEWEGITGPLTVLNEETPKLTSDTIRVEGRVQNKATRMEEGTLAAFGSWDEHAQKMVFGSADKAWLYRTRATDELFDGHGW